MNLSFGMALAALETGHKVARAGWNGKGMWLLLVAPHETQVIVDPDKGATYKRLPYIGMKTADDCFVPWLASQTDLLSKDWTVLD